MPALNKPLTILLIICTSFGAYCQKAAPILIAPVIIDTVEVKQTSTVTRMLWLNDTITIGTLVEPIEIDTAELLKMKKAFKDDSPINDKEIAELKANIKTGAQNCYSYALEKYFAHHSSFNQTLFSQTTGIDRPSAETILSKYFSSIDSFSTDSKQDLKKQLPNNVLVGFVNKENWTTHLVYYNEGVFYSKNGVFKPIEFKSLKKFLKESYIYTQQIVLYRIDEDKVRKSKPMQ